VRLGRPLQWPEQYTDRVQPRTADQEIGISKKEEAKESSYLLIGCEKERNGVLIPNDAFTLALEYKRRWEQGEGKYMNMFNGIWQKLSNKSTGKSMRYHFLSDLLRFK
jgi:hypothetical protein